MDGHSHCTRFNGHTSDLLEVIRSWHVRRKRRGFAGRDAWQQSDEVYNDDTYLVIPGCSVDSRDKEISNVEEWSRANNLTLNQAKSVEVIFRDNRKRCCTHSPSPLHGIARVTSLKLLGVTLTDKDCLSLRTWMTSSARVRGLCTPSAYCGPTVWKRQLCSSCSVR